MSHPFEEMAQIWTAQQLIDYAFGKAASQTASLPSTLPNYEKVKRKEKKRILNATNILMEKIKKIVESVPNLEELPLFYRKLSHLLVNNDEFRQALGRINGAIPVLQRLKKEYFIKINKSTSNKNSGDFRTEFFGRCASIIKKLDSTFTFLNECQARLQQVPPINLTMPSVVVAGYPNVGKSSIVGKISSAQPKVAEYPFTTKQIFIGTYKDEIGSRFFQVIDTPGILDRPMADRNEIEKQAILALNTVATIILFIVDPTKASGYEPSHQFALYRELKEHFLEGLQVPIKVVVNKIDFATPEEIDELVKVMQIPKEEMIFTNAKDGVNIDQVIKFLLKYFKETDYRR